MDKRYAIFDMDGTLVDSMRYWKNLASEYLREKGIAQVPAGLLERIKPMTMSESAELFRREFGLTGDVEGEMNAMMDGHYRRDIPLKPGVREHLNRLRQRGVKLCVASATAEHLVDACLTRLGVREDFTFVLSCESVGAGKNRPDVFHAAARKLAAAPGDIAVYEDALYAVRTAKEAGYYVVGVHDPAANWAEVSGIADETIENWEEAL